MRELLCIVVAVHHEEKALRDMLDWVEIFDSVKANVEFYFCDSGYNKELLKEFCSHCERAEFHSESDRGIYDAWNEGLARIDSDYVAFLGVTDRVHEQFVFDRSMLRDVDVLVYDFLRIEKSRPFPVQLSRPYYSRLPFRMKFCFSSAVFSRQLLVENPFDADFKIIGDLDWLWRHKDDIRISHGPGFFCEFEAGGISNQLCSHVARMKEYYRISDSLGFKVQNALPYLAFSTLKLLSVTLSARLAG
jgi:glycosyltransferase involved in cell wall biosynthesis